MKKTLVLASLLAAFGAASAQSSVTLGGATSFAFQRDAAGQVAGNNRKGLVETDFAVTLKGTEQLGNGLSASFDITLDNSGQNVGGQVAGGTWNTGAQNFRATVQRKDTFLRLASTGGSTFTLANTRGGETAVMAFVGSTNSPEGFYDGMVFARTAIDLVGYSYTMGGLTLGASHSEGGASSAANHGSAQPATRTTTFSGRYAAGPLVLAGAYKYTANNLSAVAGRHGNVELGATYDLGVAKVGFGYDAKPAYMAALPTIDKAAIAAGVNFPMGSNSFGVNFAKRGDAKILEAGFQTNLSARTNVNFSVGSMVTAIVGTNVTTTGQYRLSLNHAF